MQFFKSVLIFANYFLESKQSFGDSLKIRDVRRVRNSADQCLNPEEDPRDITWTHFCYNFKKKLTGKMVMVMVVNYTWVENEEILYFVICDMSK